MSKNLPIQTLPGWGGVGGGGGAPNFNNPHPLIIQGLDYLYHRTNPSVVGGGDPTTI